MPHEYPLHTDLQVECQCCRTPQPFRFTAPTDHVICPYCRNHLGEAKAVRRDREHVALWAEVFAEEREAHLADVAEARAAASATAAAIAVLEAQVAHLTAGLITEFDATPAGGVRAELESELVRRAERRTELAERRTDRMMAVLWRLARLHGDDGAHPQHCVCGLSSAACAEGRILAEERQAITEWEARNLTLLQQGARHALPREHPALW